MKKTKQTISSESRNFIRILNHVNIKMEMRAQPKLSNKNTTKINIGKKTNHSNL